MTYQAFLAAFVMKVATLRMSLQITVLRLAAWIAGAHLYG